MLQMIIGWILWAILGAFWGFLTFFYLTGVSRGMNLDKRVRFLKWSTPIFTFVPISIFLYIGLHGI